MSRALRLALFVSMILLLAGACASGPVPEAPQAPAADTPAAGAPQPAGEKVLVLGMPGIPRATDPLINTNTAETVTHDLMFDTLTYIGPTEDGSYGPVPKLAVSWRNIDPLTWEFKLREGVTFHNGEPFNADTVLFTVDAFLNPPEGERRGAAGRLGNLTGAEKVDDYTVRFTTSQPDVTIPLGFRSLYMIPPGYIQEVGRDRFREQLVGTGPFRFESWKTSEEVVVVANDSYWQGRPALDRVVVREIPDPFTRAAALIAGEIDMTYVFPIDLVEQIGAFPNLEVQSIPILSGWVIQFDTYGPCNPEALCDERVRQALNYAVDKEALVNTIYKGTAGVSPGQICPQGSFGYTPTVEAYPYDPERAKALLAEAGYADGFDMQIATTLGLFSGDAEVSQAVAGYLAAVGVRVQVVVMDRGQWNTIIEGRMENHHNRIPYSVPWHTAGDCALALHWISELSPDGFEAYPNERWNELVIGARQAFDAAQRLRMYEEAAQIMFQEAPLILTVQPPFVVGYNSRVKNFRIDAAQSLWLYPLDVED